MYGFMICFKLSLTWIEIHSFNFFSSVDELDELAGMELGEAVPLIRSLIRNLNHFHAEVHPPPLIRSLIRIRNYCHAVWFLIRSYRLLLESL